eukprot:2927064-Rhodomonas_salina.1
MRVQTQQYCMCRHSSTACPVRHVLVLPCVTRPVLPSACAVLPASAGCAAVQYQHLTSGTNMPSLVLMFCTALQYARVGSREAREPIAPQYQPQPAQHPSRTPRSGAFCCGITCCRTGAVDWIGDSAAVEGGDGHGCGRAFVTLMVWAMGDG